MVTRICPNAVCPRAAPTEGWIVEDTAIAYFHGLLPDGLAESWLPPMGAQWGGFADQPDRTDTDAAAPDATVAVSPCESAVCTPGWDAQRFQKFLDAIDAPSSTPQLLYHHVLLPHVPYRYLPDGTNYEPIATTWGLEPSWIDDPDFMAVMKQRYLLQAVYVDRLVGKLLDRLEAVSALDDALVVVVADHGVWLEPGSGLRGTDDGEGPARNGVQPVPLFVKLPGQRDGAIDHRPAQITDVLPTIADALDVDVPEDWQFDGRSLLSTPSDAEPRRWLDEQLSSELAPESFGERVRSSIVDLEGRRDFVGVGPYGSMIGATVADFDIVRGSGGSIRLDFPDAFDNVDRRRLVPALFTGAADGLTADDWVAVAVDGAVAGVGPVYDADGLKVVALLDPRTLGPGSHDVRAYAISDDGTVLEELSVPR
jgi:hypothetical protein